MDHKQYTDKIDSLFEHCQHSKKNEIDRYNRVCRFVKQNEFILSQKNSDRYTISILIHELQKTEKISDYDYSITERYKSIGRWFNEKINKVYSQCLITINEQIRVFYKKSLSEKKKILKDLAGNSSEIRDVEIKLQEALYNRDRLESVLKYLNETGINNEETETALKEKIKLAEENIEVIKQKSPSIELIEQKYSLIKDIVYLEEQLCDLENNKFVPAKFLTEFNSLLNRKFPRLYLANYIIEKFKEIESLDNIILVKDINDNEDGHVDDFYIHIKTTVDKVWR